MVQRVAYVLLVAALVSAGGSAPFAHVHPRGPDQTALQPDTARQPDEARLTNRDIDMLKGRAPTGI